MKILLALILGSAFGFILERVGAADPERISAMLRLRDLRLARAILLGIGISSLLLLIALPLGLVPASHLSVKTFHLGVIGGGLVFGLGWAVSGFCPGTGVTALGAGRKDAIFFVLGGLAGAGLFMAIYGRLALTRIFHPLLGGKATLADAAGIVPALAVALGLIALAVLPRERGGWRKDGSARRGNQ